MRRPVGQVLVVAVLLAQVVVGWSALTDDSSARGAPDLPVTPITMPLEPLIIETALRLTAPIAAAWDPEAMLVAASMEVLWPDNEQVFVPSSVPGGGALTLVYASDDSQLSLLMDRESGVVFHAEVGSWSDVLALPLPTDRITRSSSIAVLAAEVSYGTSYRAACPEYRFVTRVHLTPRGGEVGNPAWLVSYVDERHRDRPDIQITVDAVTGRTVGGQTSAVPCVEEE